MAKGFFSMLFLLIIQGSFAQQRTFTKAEKATLDSMFENDEFFNMLKKSITPKSYFQVNAVLGNNYFSIKNKRIGATQLESKLVFTPGVTYLHKSGMSIAAAAFLTSYKGKTAFYQFSLTPSYAYTKSKYFFAVVSFTRFFRRNDLATASSPIQNDLFGTFNLKKPWLEPGISLGYSSGKNTEYKKIDTVLFGARRVFIDTTKIKINNFSISVFIQHSFQFANLLKKHDALLIRPKLILNAGSNRYSETHYNPYSAFFYRRAQRRNNLGRLQDNTPFEFQSIAGSLDLNYLVGKFGISPQVYLDYYFPESSDKKFTAIYSVALSYTF